jgi:4-hydroxyphenylpyruvate dioxygenase
MRHSIATVSLSGTLIEKVKAIANAGYDGLELFENDLTVSNLRPSELRQITTDLGLEIIGLQPFRDYEAMPEPFKSRSLDRAKYKFELMQQLGTKKLFICSNTSIYTINSFEKAAEDLYDIAELAKKHGFEIGYEALSWGRCVNTYHQSVEIVRRANHPNLGNILDNFHISVVGSTFEDIYTIPKEKLTVVQVADAMKHDMGAMHIARHLRCFPGQGSFPVVEFMAAVRATGYDGYISHEIFSDEFRASQIDPVALDGKRSLAWLSQPRPYISNALSLNTSATGVAFIEFASTTDSQGALIEMLENFGFVEAYQHKTKEVSLYRLASVHVVINRQPSQSIENSVCALGLVVSDKKQLENWAKQLCYEWTASKASATELEIPSVKGPGGMTYYFVEESQLKSDFYEVEFNPTHIPQNQSGIIGIDHIGHSTSSEVFLSNTLFHRVFLGLNIEESVELLDPRGIVYSRVATNAKGTIRIPLSSTRSRGTATEQFVNQTGAGIQQIALQSEDIFLTAASLKNKDLILSIPPNYYDDLRAKTQLSDQIIAQMQEYHILYDRQENGEFLHFYCQEFNGLFIEVVQRKGLYNRYGEVNAQVRLAAQGRGRSER